MESKKIKGRVYPEQLYLTCDKRGIYHWYRRDPMGIPNREEEELSSIEDLISDFYGRGDVANPVTIFINGVKIVRTEKFDILQMVNIRQGTVNRHIEDMEGSVVDILEVRNADPSYPLNGVVFDRRGNILETRTYSIDGLCKDGNEEHSLMAVNGKAVMETYEEKPGEEA